MCKEFIENPHWKMETLNIWARKQVCRILGQFFFDRKMDGEQYSIFLQDELFISLAVSFLNAEDSLQKEILVI